jgi:hypothetical protein
MDKERLDFHTALVNKIKEWEGTADFSAGSTNRQKLNRSLNLLLGTNPDVLVDFFDIDTVPDNPREAMNLIRGADLKTLKDVEIFRLKGLGDKLVGHHEVAANTLGVHLNNMSPSDRLDVYKGMLDLGQKHGMDPRQIMTIPDAIHRTIAHGGDFKGIKTGAMLPLIIGESGTQFLKRFEQSINLQLGMGRKAIADPSTQSWKAAMSGAAQGLGLPDENMLFDMETPLPVKGAASDVLAPIAADVKSIVQTPGATPELITSQTKELVERTPLKEAKIQRLFAEIKGGNVRMAGFDPNIINMMATDPVSMAAGGVVEAAKTVRANPLGAAVGVLGGLDTESVKLAREGQYGQAALQTAGGALVGAGVEAVGKRVAPMAMQLIPQAGKMVMGAVGAPLAAGMAGYQALDIITTAATGKTLQETGQAAEQTKEELRQQGMSEYQLRRLARTGR